MNKKQRLANRTTNARLVIKVTPPGQLAPCLDGQPGHLPIGWTGPILCEICGQLLGHDEAPPAPEPRPYLPPSDKDDGFPF
jgi:hypothetical protein